MFFFNIFFLNIHELNLQNLKHRLLINFLNESKTNFLNHILDNLITI
jgi:hypothetical protein